MGGYWEAGFWLKYESIAGFWHLSIKLMAIRASSGDKDNGFRQAKAYSLGKMLELRVPRTREGNFYPVLRSILHDQIGYLKRISGLLLFRVANAIQRIVFFLGCV